MIDRFECKFIVGGETFFFGRGFHEKFFSLEFIFKKKKTFLENTIFAAIF